MIWPLLIGINKAKEYLIRGTLLKGKEAERIGLVNHVAPRAEVLAKARTPWPVAGASRTIRSTSGGSIRSMR